jgi:hypothetical protein
MRAVRVLCGAVALTAFLAPGAHADEWNKRTYLTFSGPVQIPGATLPAGTYTFEIANPDTMRHVIRVSEKDTNKPIGLFMTTPMDRLDPPNDNLIMFSERPAGTPQAIQVWFYPGDRIGEEFVYPKSQAVAIAKANHKAVLATNAENNRNASESDRMAAMKGASIGRVDENGQMKSDESKAATTTADEKNQSSTAASAAPANTVDGSRSSRVAKNTAIGTSGQNETTQNGRRRQLPRTASNLAAFELLSGLAFAGAVAAHRLRGYADAKQ